VLLVRKATPEKKEPPERREQREKRGTRVIPEHRDRREIREMQAQRLQRRRINRASWDVCRMPLFRAVIMRRLLFMGRAWHQEQKVRLPSPRSHWTACIWSAAAHIGIKQRLSLV